MVKSRTIHTGRVGAEGAAVVLDTRLIAAVQAAAGAQCHEAANLLQAYYYSAEAYRCVGAAGNRGSADEALRLLLAAKVRLRDFLARRVFDWIGNAPAGRRLNRDIPCGTVARRPVAAAATGLQLAD